MKPGVIAYGAAYGGCLLNVVRDGVDQVSPARLTSDHIAPALCLVVVSVRLCQVQNFRTPGTFCEFADWCAWQDRRAVPLTRICNRLYVGVRRQLQHVHAAYVPRSQLIYSSPFTSSRTWLTIRARHRNTRFSNDRSPMTADALLAGTQ